MVDSLAVPNSPATSHRNDPAKKDGTVAKVLFMLNPNLNLKLHAVGATYGLKKHVRDKPHWSVDGY